MKIPEVALEYFLRKSFAQETSLVPHLWTPQNPSEGHCALCALVAQDFYGGKILRGLLSEEWKSMLGFRSHYWNVLGSGEIIDFSQEQFPPDFPYAEFVSHHADQRDRRDYVLSYEETKKRYEVFEKRVGTIIDSDPLFKDEKFLLSWELAFSGESVCPKMRFACLVYEGEKLIASSANKHFTTQFGKERLCAFNGSSCVREGLQHREDATIGDCGHAPIWCLSQVFELGYKPSDLPKLDFYEGGFFPDGSPWWRKEASSTCTYCQNMFAIFGLDKIWGAFDGIWSPLWTKDSLYSSVDYAMLRKKA